MSAKMPIEWHEKCLKNQKLYIEREEEELSRLKYALEVKLSKQKIDTAFYETQINEAKKQGKEGFDSSRFMVKKSKEATP